MAVESSCRDQIQRLQDDGFSIAQRFIPVDALATLNRTAQAQLEGRAEPLELEADLHYPGAPASHASAGGATVRRLLDAYQRDPVFAEWAVSPRISEWMGAYFGEPVVMSRAHHNCLMTKHPRFGSMTGWHRDMRFWSFAKENLVSVWLALGEEIIDNGALWFVPGSHRMHFESERFDADKFFRSDRADNVALLDTATSPRLAAGDAVFFHCNTLHSAGKNLTTDVKMSLVYTYHGRSNAPVAGTRSAARPEIDVGQRPPQAD